MLRLTVQNILANKIRVALITLAVVIGVSFVSSTFLFSDSLSRTFDDLASDVSAGTDLQVRPIEEFGASGALTNETVELVQGLDGVRAVAAERESEGVAPIAPDGDLVDRFGVGLSWIDDSELGGFDLVEGRAPRTGEFVLSANTATDEGFRTGRTYDISTPTGTVQRTLSGLVSFRGGELIEANVAFTMVPLADAQQIFGGTPDQVDALSIAVDDTTTAAAVQAEAEAVVGEQIEVVNQRTVEQERTADFNSQIAILRNVLLGFAIVSLFVSTFIIYNTFGIILSQRVREIGLLRAIGADAGHIGRSVIGEAIIIGVIASVAGLLGGFGLNAALIALLNRLGASFPDMETVIASRTVILAFAIGIGVTVLSALGPAREASQVSPVTAMRGLTETTESFGKRVFAGIVLTAIGALSGGFGLFAASGTTAVLTGVGVGIAAMFLGITLMSPKLVQPLVSALGTPFSRVGGVAGTLATGNASRNRQRTANTAAALMIGLALITTALVVGQSVKTHLASTLDNSVTADFVISNDFEPMTDVVATRVDALPELGAVASVSEIEVKIGNEIREIEVANLGSLTELFDLGITEGTRPDLVGAFALLSEDTAADLAVVPGESIQVQFANGAEASFEVTGLYTDTTLLESGLLLDRATSDAAMPLDTVDWVAAKTTAGTGLDTASTALQTISSEFPQLQVQTAGEYRELVESQVDQLLSIINVMLALSIVIALIGIGLTLALSIFERTREIGLLRAVGMSTRQVRRMVRFEAALIALFGAVLGVGTGLLYGSGAVTALPDSIATNVSVPGSRLVVLVLASAIAGVLAAMLPARRAARMNILDSLH